MNQQRSDAAACSMAGKVYVAGGYNGERVLQSIEVYSLEKDIWIEIAHMDSPRSGRYYSTKCDCIQYFSEKFCNEI